MAAFALLAAGSFIPAYAAWTEYRNAPEIGEQCLRQLDTACVRTQIDESYGIAGSAGVGDYDAPWVWVLRFVESDVDYRAQLEAIFDADGNEFTSGLREEKLEQIAIVSWFLAANGETDASRDFLATLLDMQRERGGTVPASLETYEPWAARDDIRYCMTDAERGFESSSQAGSLTQKGDMRRPLKSCYLEYFRTRSDVDLAEVFGRTLDELREDRRNHGEEPHKYGYGEGFARHQYVDRIAAMAAIAAYRRQGGWEQSFD